MIVLAKGEGRLCVEVRPLSNSSGGSVNFRVYVNTVGAIGKDSLFVLYPDLPSIVSSLPRIRLPLEMGRVTVNLMHDIKLAEMKFWPYKELYKRKIWSFENHGIAQAVEGRVFDYLKV